jgi:hypothetical protein
MMPFPEDPHPLHGESVASFRRRESHFQLFGWLKRWLWRRKRNMGFCCEEMAKVTTEHEAFAGGGGLYPSDMEPDAHIEQSDDGSWHVNGCCGGGCYVLNDIKFCPFCAAKLPTANAKE